jgi:hypothetical protein
MDEIKPLENSFANYVLKNIQSILGLHPTVNTTLITTFVTPSVKVKIECIFFMCARIKFHT